MTILASIAIVVLFILLSDAISRRNYSHRSLNLGKIEVQISDLYSNAMDCTAFQH